VEGETWNGSKVTPYTVFSDLFEIVGSSDIIVQELMVTALGANQYNIECNGYWPPNPEGYRVRHFEFSPNDPSPVAGGSALATINMVAGGTETVVLSPTSEGHFEGVYSPVGVPETVTIESGDLQDAYDNTNGGAAGPVAFP